MRAKPFSTMHSRYRRNRMTQTGLAVAAAILLLVGLAACNSSAARSPSVSTRSATGSQPTANAASGSPTRPTIPPTATPNPNVLQVNFSDQYTAAICGGTAPAGTTCVSTNGFGQDAALGGMSLSRTSVYAPLGADSCTSATTQGTLTVTATGDAIKFTGKGTFCAATQIASFTYTISGGTGSYQHATGSGSINVPLPSSSTAGTEIWSGSIFTS
jgi:hypothetical protein